MTTRLLALLLLLSPGLAWGQELRVAAVNGPLAYFARALGGDAVEVYFPVPEGVDPASWRPAIAEIAQYQKSDLILLNGAGYAGWTTKAALPRAKTVNTGKAFEDQLIRLVTAVTHSHGADGEHSHTGTANQTWLDLEQATRQAAAVAEALRRRLPDRAEAISAAEAELASAMAERHARALDLGAELAGARVIAALPGLEYFARAYGLDAVSLAWTPGAAPGPEEISALEAALPARLFIWQQAPADAARAAVADLGLAQAVIDPSARAGTDFLAVVDANLDALEAAIAASD